MSVWHILWLSHFLSPLLPPIHPTYLTRTEVTGVKSFAGVCFRCVANNCIALLKCIELGYNLLQCVANNCISLVNFIALLLSTTEDHPSTYTSCIASSCFQTYCTCLCILSHLLCNFLTVALSTSVTPRFFLINDHISVYSFAFYLTSSCAAFWQKMFVTVVLSHSVT